MLRTQAAPEASTSSIRKTKEKNVENSIGEIWEVTDDDVNNLPMGLGMHSTVSTTVDNDTFIYIIGGCKEQFNFLDDSYMMSSGPTVWPLRCSRFSRKLLRYDPKYDVYKTMSDLPEGRYGHTSVVVDGRIWVIGGRKKEKVTDEFGEHTLDTIMKDIAVYDIAKNKWRTINEFDKATANGASFSLKSGYLYYAGGFDDTSEATKMVMMIDTDATLNNNSVKYDYVASLNTPRGHMNAVVANGHAIIAGGSTNVNYCQVLESVEEYNPEALTRSGNLWDKDTPEGEKINMDRWTFLGELDDGAGSMSVLNLNNQILVFGGVRNRECKMDWDKVTNVHALDWLDEASKDWYLHGTIPENRFLYSVVGEQKSDSALIFGGVNYFNEDCNCLPVIDVASRYHKVYVDKSSLNAGTIAAIWFLSISAAIFVGVLIWYRWFSGGDIEAPIDTIFNPNAVSSLPGAVESVEKDEKIQATEIDSLKLTEDSIANNGSKSGSSNSKSISSPLEENIISTSNSPSLEKEVAETISSPPLKEKIVDEKLIETTKAPVLDEKKAEDAETDLLTTE